MHSIIGEIHVLYSKLLLVYCNVIDLTHILISVSCNNTLAVSLTRVGRLYRPRQ